MKKKNAKKLQLHRETLVCLEMVKGGGKVAAGGTHYRSICVDLCEDTDTPTVATDLINEGREVEERFCRSSDRG